MCICVRRNIRTLQRRKADAKWVRAQKMVSNNIHEIRFSYCKPIQSLTQIQSHSCVCTQVCVFTQESMGFSILSECLWINLVRNVLRVQLCVFHNDDFELQFHELKTVQCLSQYRCSHTCTSTSIHVLIFRRTLHMIDRSERECIAIAMNTVSRLLLECYLLHLYVAILQ